MASRIFFFIAGAHQQFAQRLLGRVGDVNPVTRGFARAPFDMAFTRPTPPCGG